MAQAIRYNNLILMPVMWSTMIAQWHNIISYDTTFIWANRIMVIF